MKKIKVGDRVEYVGIDSGDPISYGDKGTVLECYEASNSYAVEWDKGHPRMHDNDGNGEMYHCWCVRAVKIKKVSEGKMTNNEVINVLMKKLGVEIGEEFEIEDGAYNPYHFDEKGNLVSARKFLNSGTLVQDLIYGKKSIKKIPIEMTIADIEKKLGYRIKVIKG